MGYNPTITNPDDYETGVDEVALREEIRDGLTGESIMNAICEDDALTNKLEALLSLVAAGANDDCDHGRKLRALVAEACELAIDFKVRQS